MRKLLTIVVIVILLTTTVPLQTFAWCNGPTKNGQVGSGYGSHDWILDQAIKKAGVNGKWVQRTTALLSTDDPDSQKWSVVSQHFNATGSMRGGPQYVSDLYHKAVVAYQSGDRAAASKYLGQLSHCYTDIMQPFHDVSNDLKTLHLKYEYVVDDHQNTSTKSLSWLGAYTPQPIKDVRVRAIAAGNYARGYYSSLVSSYKSSGSVTSGTSGRITKKLMTRAVNDLADIIVAIPSGSGETTVPATLDIRLTRSNPRQYSGVGAQVTILDFNGNSMDAVGIKYIWHFASGNIVYSTYSSANGYNMRYQNIGSSPIGVPITVSVQATVNGQTITKSTSFTPVR